MLTDTTCRNLKPQQKPQKKSDGGGLYLLVTPSGGKLWRMAFRFAGKQKELAFGAYPDLSLGDARAKRDAARKLLANGIDPAAAKQEAKRELAAARTFGQWADEWLEQERTERDEKTMAGKERFAGYLKEEFGDRLISAIKRPDVLLFLRKIEQTGKLETRDRTRATGEAIYGYADIDASEDSSNPFRKFDKHKLKKNVSTPRPALIKPVLVAKLFRDIAAPFDRARFGDLVGYALRFLALTVVRPGEIASAEWSDFDLENAQWIIPAEKMKMDREHIVPLSRQAIAILAQVRGLTGNRSYVFSCSKDDPISDNTLCRRLRDLGYNTSNQHCAHGFRSTFSTLMNGEIILNRETKQENKMWDSALIELQLAHVEESSVKGIYDRVTSTTLIGARANLLQYWADKIDTLRDGGNVVPFDRKHA